MIIGNGQLAKALKKIDSESICIFASGVANSSCTDTNEFMREEDLLVNELINHNDKLFIYFSSCALSDKTYSINKYYEHKQRMEFVIQKSSQNYLIFRLPQLFGHLKKHNTIINFFYESIQNGNEFEVYNNAHRYVIEINDVVTLVQAYINRRHYNSILNIANWYRYKVEIIVKILEQLTNKKAYYRLIEIEDHYQLDLSSLHKFCYDNFLDLDFGESYLSKKLCRYMFEVQQTDGNIRCDLP